MARRKTGLRKTVRKAVNTFKDVRRTVNSNDFKQHAIPTAIRVGGAVATQAAHAAGGPLAGIATAHVTNSLANAASHHYAKQSHKDKVAKLHRRNEEHRKMQARANKQTYE